MESLRVLIVEDEMMSALLLKKMLIYKGHRVIDIVINGRDAIDSAIKHKPDLIISDIMLKNHIDGIDAVSEIQRVVDVPVIYITALKDDFTIERAKQTNPLDIVFKPYDTVVLHSIIDTIHLA
ncbi:MAG: response regulator [bacterium]|nr:response regulator [bacterium]